MTEISIFLAGNYVWFIIADIFVLFALIGYMRDPNNKIKRKKKLETIKFEDKNNVVEELIMQDDNSNKSLNSVINSNSKKAKKEETEIL